MSDTSVVVFLKPSLLAMGNNDNMFTTRAAIKATVVAQRDAINTPFDCFVGEDLDFDGMG